ncbi:MAG TPA: SMP-30/gluconolactonase/LRE family protein, partial [Opitutaceae bacterium]|nr:SMP-30/gluconolactonase/LRE family protein [Opitutaceae bacterium]
MKWSPAGVIKQGFKLGLGILCPTLLLGAQPETLPGLQQDGSVLLPNQWSLRPTGKQVPVGDFPVNMAFDRSGKYVAVLHSGYSQHEVRILNVATNQPVSQAAIDESFYGLAFSRDGSRLFTSGASAEVIHEFNFKNGYLSDHRELSLRGEKELGGPSGISLSGDGASFYVAELWGQRVLRVDFASGKPLWTHVIAPAKLEAEGTDPEAERWAPVVPEDSPFPYTCLADEKRGHIYVSLWAKSSVLVLDAKTGKEVAQWPVGQHPNEMVLSKDGRLFVAEANLNTVSVLSVSDGKVMEKLSCVMDPNALPGSMPNSVALTPDEKTLFIANANNNSVAVFDVSEARKSESLGFIPVGWFPTSVRVTPDGKQLLVANGKGVTSAANPRGPFPGDKRPRNLQEYIGSLMQGTVSFIKLPTKEERVAFYGKLTPQVYQNSPHRSETEHPADSPIPAKLGDPSPIRHVIYVVKENRTYDQVLGDLPQGNGDARLCL